MVIVGTFIVGSSSPPGIIDLGASSSFCINISNIQIKTAPQAIILANPPACLDIAYASYLQPECLGLPIPYLASTLLKEA